MISPVNNKIFYIIFFSLFFVRLNIAFAVEGSPQDIVKKYYTADLNGVRLSGQTYENIKPLITWEHEPGWDTEFITDEVKIYSTKLNNDEALVEVRYHIIGIFSGENLLKYDFNEVIDFILIREGKEWKIKKPIFPPHVLPSTAIRHLEYLIRIEGTRDTSKVEKIKHNIERLRDMAK